MEKHRFVSTVRDWLACDAELTKLQRATKELRARKKELGDVVMQEMEEQNLTLLDTGSTHLKITKTRRKQPLTRKYLEGRLAEMFGPGTDMYKQAEEEILNKRPIKEHKELKARTTKS